MKCSEARQAGQEGLLVVQKSRSQNPPSRSQSVAGGSWTQREGEEEGIWSSSEEAFSREVIDKVVIL